MRLGRWDLDWVGVGDLGGNTVGGAKDGEGGKILLAAPMTGMGEELRVVVVE